jgi:hypothetical protein
MAMFTAEEGDGLHHLAENLGPHGTHSSLLEELFSPGSDFKIGQTNVSAEPDFFSRLFGEGDASSILQSPNGSDFQLVDSSTFNGAGGDITSSLPKGDMLGTGVNLDSIGSTMGDIAGSGMPMGFLSQLFQFLMSLFTEGVNGLGSQMNQMAAAAASEATKKLRV